MSLFAQLGLSAAALGILRIIAAIGGAFVGWLFSDPVARIAYRLTAAKPIPGWTLPWLKLAGGVGVGLLVYFFIPLGGGPGGWGNGPGPGGSPGHGPGAGGTETGTTPPVVRPSDSQTPVEPVTPKQPPAKAIVRQPIDIEVLGGKRYPGGDRYYLLRSTGKAMTLGEIEQYCQQHGDRLELHVVLTDDSPDDITGITQALTRLADRYQIPSLLERPKPGP